MILPLLLFNSCLCLSLRPNCSSRKLFFIRSQLRLPHRNGTQRIFEYDESFNDLVDNLETDNTYTQEAAPERDPPREHFDLSANSVTICGRIGFIAEPLVFQNGVKCLKLSVATSERTRSGQIKTEWHKVMLYGMGNVDYIYSRARYLPPHPNQRLRVGDRALAIGQLRYYQPPNLDSNGINKAKIAEVTVNSSRGNHTFILLPKNHSTLENTYLDENQQVYSNNY